MIHGSRASEENASCQGAAGGGGSQRDSYLWVTSVLVYMGRGPSFADVDVVLFALVRSCKSLLT